MALPGRIDLHCHSTATDGVLPPQDLVRLAQRNGVKLLALTDHDQTCGLNDARRTAHECGIAFVDGVEISVTWNDHSIHVVGLRIDPENRALAAGLASLRAGRAERAARIAASLADAGIAGALEGALAHAPGADSVSRTHFARFLVSRGCAADVHAVFRRYLARGKPGFVAHRWAGLAQAIDWIRGAGGIAVLAHPCRYRLAHGDLTALVGEFRDLGGRSIEVLCGSQSVADTRRVSRMARRFGLLASSGSDYHGPTESRIGPGVLPVEVDGVAPVWREFAAPAAAAAV